MGEQEMTADAPTVAAQGEQAVEDNAPAGAGKADTTDEPSAPDDADDWSSAPTTLMSAATLASVTTSESSIEPSPPLSLSASVPTLTLYPALDLLNGRCVRQIRGAAGQADVEDDDPIAVARRWQSAGATWLYVVDLDGAREGGVRHAETLRAIADATGLRIQFGGGVQSEDDVAAAFAAGATRVTLATAVVRESAAGAATLAACLARWGDRIAVSVDAHDEQITVGGWLPWATERATDFAQAMANLGVRTLIVTNLDRNGALAPGMDGARPLLAELRAALPDVALIATGGVATLDDLRRLAQLGVAGVVIGRALYDGSLDLADALAVAANPNMPDNANAATDVPDATNTSNDSTG